MLIAYVSRKYDISAHTLRYYERVGLIPAVHRRDNGIRDYDEGDLNWVEFIKCMRSAGIQVEALIEYVALYQQGDETNEARKEILVEQRAQLMQRMADMESTLERLNYKIDNYDRVMRNSIDMSKCKNSDG